MIYFDNSATSRFKPKCVIEEYNRFVLNSCNSGRSGHKDCIQVATKVLLARESIKKWLEANDDYEVIFTSNCTQALNMAILGYVTPNSHVITTVYEHNSVLRPLQFLQDNYGVKVTYLSPDLTGFIKASDLEAAITDDTKLVVVNQTSNVTGFSQDIEEIGKITKKHNIKLLVDTAQSLGHEPIEMQHMNIDMLASCGHKGIHGMQGVGILVIKKDIALKHILFGGTGTDSDVLTQPDHMPEGYECGTINTGGILSLSKAFDWTYSNFATLNRHYKYLSSEILYGLKSMPKITCYSDFPSTVISIKADGYSSNEVAEHLNNHNIAVRSGLHCAPKIHSHLGTIEDGLCRISIGYNNSINDCHTLLNALSKLN